MQLIADLIKEQHEHTFVTVHYSTSTAWTEILHSTHSCPVTQIQRRQ
jgi:hypothetical protein